MTVERANEVGIPRPEPEVEEAVHHLAGARRYEVLAAVMTVMFFSSMASTIVSTALPNIIGDLNGLSLYAWVFTAFILASAIVIPIYGKLSDIFGRKPLYIAAILLYLAGNIIAGFSQSMLMLVLARAVSGLGGGGMQALSQITIGDIFTPKERGRWMGVMMSAFGLASIIGPTLGGFITDHFSWRWVFWINVPFAVLPLFMLMYALPTIRNPRKVTIDYLGILALVVGLIPILFAITWIGDGDTLGTPRVAGGIIFGLVVLGLFVWQEMRAEEPVVAPSFFKNRIFVVSMLASFCLALGMYGGIMFVPLFVQGVVGTSAQDSGVVLAPMMLGFIAGSFLSGQAVSRWGRYRMLALAGLVISCLGMFLFGRMTADTTNLTVVRNMVVLGIGIGGTMPLFTIAVQNAFPYRVLGQVTGTRQFFTSLGGAIGVPIMGALLNSHFQGAFVSHLSPTLRAMMHRQGASTLNPTTLISAEAQAAIHQKFAALGPQGQQLYAQFIHAVREGLAISLSDSFHVAFAFMVAALIITLFLHEIPLRTHFHETAMAVTDETATLAGAAEPVRAPERA
jgi:EmrB/QacA subfamily drug resistance transporter